MGIKFMVSESCLYHRVYKGSLNLIALYVDDLIICGVMEAIDNVKQQLCARYKMKDLGIIHRILGCEVLNVENAGTFSINQSKYIKFVGATVQTPMSDTTLSKEMSPKSDDERNETKNIPYKAAIGCLLWLVAGTRLDIAFATQTCARYIVDPGKQHWEAEIRVMRYLKGTAGYGIVYPLTTISRLILYRSITIGP